MADQMPADIEQKAEIMRDFRRLRSSGEPVPPELHARHVAATIDPGR